MIVDPLLLAQTVSVLATSVMELSKFVGATEVDVPSLDKLKENVDKLRELPDFAVIEARET